MKLLVDMNLPPLLADTLTEMGIESEHWYRVGAPDAKDSEIMTYAIEHDYSVLSCDLDFSSILAATHGHKPSVVQIRIQGYQSEKLAELIFNALSMNTSELESGAILTIDLKKARLRLLPL